MYLRVILEDKIIVEKYKQEQPRELKNVENKEFKDDVGSKKNEKRKYWSDGREKC